MAPDHLAVLDGATDAFYADAHNPFAPRLIHIGHEWVVPEVRMTSPCGPARTRSMR